MNILLLSPPSISAANVIRDGPYGCWCQGKRVAGAQVPPYPLLLMGSLLEQQGYSVRVIDAHAQDIDLKKLSEIIKEFRVVVINSSVMTFYEDEIILKLLKQANRNLVTIVTGAQPTFMSEATLGSESVDFIVRREPEFVLRDLIKGIAAQNSDWESLKGIGYKDAQRFYINDFYPLITNLDELPFVNWDLLPVTKRYFNPIVKRKPYVVDLTSRGCYANCNFCMSPSFYGNKIRTRSAENILEGFRRHIKAGFKEVYLRDEMFTSFKERNYLICETMLKEKMDLTWICSSRADTVDKSMLKLMKKAGCHTIKFGVESGVQKILDSMNKGITLQEIEETFKLCKEVGIRTHAHLMVGNPGENWDTLKQTIRFVKKISPTTATFGMFTPYPGTKIFEEISKKYPQIREGFKLATKDLHIFSFFTETICELNQKELSRAVTKMHRWFYWRPLYIASWLGRVRDLNDFRKIIKAAFNIMDFSFRGE